MPGSMGGFRTLTEIGAELDRLHNTYPSIVSAKYSIGSSLENRPIWAVRLSDNPSVDEPNEPVAWFDALHHAREPMGAEALLRLVDWIASRYPADPAAKRMVETRQVVIVPCVNPDGYEYNRATNPGGGGIWRKNRRPNAGGSFGVDLNRNYGWEWGPSHPGSSTVPSDDTYHGTAGFSEPETRAVRDALLAHPPGMAVSAHTYSDLWLYAWGYEQVVTQDEARFQQYGARVAGQNGYAYGTPWQLLYIANGGSLDWGYGALGSFFFSPEIGSSADGFWPPPSRIPALFEAVRAPFLDVVRWTGGWAERRGTTWTQVPGLGDGDAYVEPGETWDLVVELANGGVAPVNGALTLASSSLDAVVRNATIPFAIGAGILPVTASQSGPLVRAVPIALPLRVEFAPGAPVGSTISLELGIAFEGLVTPDVVSVRLGAPHVLASDDMEVADFGWTVTTTGANYAFQRAVPQQTTVGANVVQPGTDATPGAGTRCWVTGAAAGTSVGTNDVDGTTTLTSPRFSAAGFPSVELEYARWFACQPGGPLDDRLLVQVSNDDGNSWFQVENPANANAWTKSTFDLGAILPLTHRMRLRVTCADSPNNDITEAALDDLVLRTWSSLPTLGAWGATTAGSGARLFVDGPANRPFRVRVATSEQAGQATPGTQGLSYLAGTVTDLVTGTTGADGRAIASWTSASSSAQYLQVLVDEGGPDAAWSNLLRVNAP
ncbi:MAG: M14 family metallopeptidase [Planctomycetota bacterium]|nr:M14 family metallopeptidase [Planctomycetota bacterium]